VTMCTHAPPALATTAPVEALTAPSLLGAEIDPALPAAEAARAFAERYLDESVDLVIDRRVLTMKRRDLGAELDVASLTALIEDARDADGSHHRLRKELELEGPLALPLPISLRAEAAMGPLLAAKREVDLAPRDARFELATRTVVPERVGRVLDVFGTLDRIRDAMRTGAPRIEARITREEPRRTAADLAALRVDAVVGSFETRYSLTDAAAERTQNLELAAARIDGTVLLPGEVFDFNEVVGPRTQANGFRNATVIAGGELTEDVGGGACQISGTLHAAALFGGLEIAQRSPHSRPSSYIKLGLDAMVNYPTVNFRFRNDLDFPVLLHVTIGGGIARAQILGAEQARMVTFVRRIDAVRPYVEQIREDPSLPAGVRVLDQRGVAGFRVTRLRVTRDPATNQAVRTRTRDVYPPTTQIWRVGTGDAAREGYIPPAGDTHPEYRADAFMTMTQGPGIVGTVERREPGTTGTPGWTAASGMPQSSPL
ncbi:MAG: VanW family protein, partial [Polyangiaceae bacterium]|nr:VanW family protein [Polyangiaceae bacterium]